MGKSDKIRIDKRRIDKKRNEMKEWTDDNSPSDPEPF